MNGRIETPEYYEASASHAMHLEIKAADVLRAHIADIADGDEILVRDTIEGQTSLRELIAIVCSEIVIDGVQVNGIASLMNSLKDRKVRIEQRIAMKRAACLAAMSIAEIKTIETPSGTLTRKNVPQSALIIDEAEIPAKFWKPSEPTLDKRAVLDALKSKEVVPGAQLSNGSETLQIKV